MHSTILTLERRGLITRAPGQARSIALRLPPQELPPLYGSYANLATNAGEICSSRSRRMTTWPYASCEWPAAFWGPGSSPKRENRRAYARSRSLRLGKSSTISCSGAPLRERRSDVVPLAERRNTSVKFMPARAGGPLLGFQKRRWSRCNSIRIQGTCVNWSILLNERCCRRTGE